MAEEPRPYDGRANLAAWNAERRRKMEEDPYYRDERMCKAKFKDPNRAAKGGCRAWRMHGSDYCKRHGGRQHKKNQKSTKTRLSQLPPVYGKHLNNTLCKEIEEALGAKPSDQLKVLEELALMRHFAGQTVALYSGAVAANNPGAIQATGSFMAERLKDVVKLSETAARITAATSDNYSIHDIQYIVYQLVHILHNICGRQHEDIAIRFEAELKTQLKLPRAPEGVTHEPHQDVAEMDGMVPLVVEGDVIPVDGGDSGDTGLPTEAAEGTGESS